MLEGMRILMADDQADVRSALRLLLTQQPGVVVVGESADSSATLTLAELTEPDVLLLDWELPGMPPRTLLRLLRCLSPALRVVAMSSRPEAAAAALDCGASAFVSKAHPVEHLLAVLQGVGR